MFLYLYAAEFYRGLEQLHDYEVALIHNTSTALPSVEIDFITAWQKGNCIAPYFLDYMRRKKLIHSLPVGFPNLSTVPSHKGQGAVWVDAYETYLEYLEIVRQREQPQVREIKKLSKVEAAMRSAQYSAGQLKEQQSKLHDKLFGMDMGFPKLLCAKILEMHSMEPGFIRVCYAQSVHFVNIWAMKEYSRFLSTHRNLVNDLDKELLTKLRVEMAVLMMDPNNGPGAIYASYEREGSYSKFKPEDRAASARQWAIEAAVHGEIDNPFFMIQRYLNPVMQWTPPISREDAEKEAEKWFDWIMERKVQYKNFHEGFLAAFEFLFAQELQDKCDFLRVKMHTYIYQFTTEFPLIRFMDIDAFLTIQKSLYRIAKQFPDAKLLIENPNNPNELGRYFENTMKDNVRAELWYRKSLSLNPDSPIVQYNVANVLRKQKKNFDEMLEWFLKSADQGDNDAIAALINIALDQCNPTISLLNGCMRLVEGFNKEPFLSHKDLVRKLINKKLIEIQEQESPEADLEIVAAEEANDDDADNTDIEPDEAVAVAKAIPQETEEECAARKMKKAKDKLEEFASKPLRNIKTKDFRRIAKYLRTLWGIEELSVSTGGAATGSATSLEGNPFHVEHAQGLSPGAQSTLRAIARRAL